MIQNLQVKKLRRLLASGKTLAQAALVTGMCERSARKYRNMNTLPSDSKTPRSYRTRQDPLEAIWPSVEEMLIENPGLQAKTILQWLCREHPGVYDQGHLRTLQRRIKQWRACDGPAKEVFFTQVHQPGDLSASDFTVMTELDVRISGQLHPHMVHHFVLTYSNWEAVTRCYSESFESLSEGMQNALQRLGGVPRRHRTDSLSAAVNSQCDRSQFTQRWTALMAHYDVAIEKTQPRHPNENGDVESSHRGLKTAVGQALMLRGSRDFATLEDYDLFLQGIVDERNSARAKRVGEEQAILRKLPGRRLDAVRIERMRVNTGSLIRVGRNTYSVHSRLIGEQVEARIHVSHIEIWYGQRCVDRFDRLRGRGKHHVNYIHIIDFLVRKPGAFENYKYQDSLFPTSNFRIAYDMLGQQHAHGRRTKEYLAILLIAARQSESQVEAALRDMLVASEPITSARVQHLVQSALGLPASVTDINIDAVDPASFDCLLSDAASLEVIGQGAAIQTAALET